MRQYSASGSNLFQRFLHRNKGNIVQGLQRELKGKLLRNKVARSLITPFYKQREPEKWLFLVGCYNSGTTILREIIASHELVSDLPFEGVNLTDAFPKLEQGGWPRMMFKNRHLWGSLTSESNSVATKAKKDWSPWWPKESTIFLEKSIDQSTRIKWLAEHFPNAHFIYIVRNGYCVSEGIMRRSKPTGKALEEVGDKYPATLVAEQWVNFSNFIENEIEGLDNVLQLKYEDLTDNPVQTVQQIYSFLDLPSPDIEFDDSSLFVNKKGFSLKNQNQNSINRISKEDKAAMSTVMGETLEKHGYGII